jgi:hypothetical protein
MSIDMRDVFTLSASENLIAPSLPISLSVWSENETSQTNNLLPPILSKVRDEFDLSASANLVAPSGPILISALSENEMKQQVCYPIDRAN